MLLHQEVEDRKTAIRSIRYGLVSERRKRGQILRIMIKGMGWVADQIVA
jgi:hypothetical protein